MAVGDGLGAALRWAMCLAVLSSAACDALDRGLLDPVVPRPGPGDGMNGPLDSGGGPLLMDSGVTMPPPAMDSGVTMPPPVMDSAALDDARVEPDDGGQLDAAERDAGDTPDPPDAAPLDLCPNDPLKTEPGACGCGLAETEAATCSALHAALKHRYRFDGTGTVLEDSVADADGTVVNATLDDSGTLTLAGGTSNQHVDLPDGMISALTDATFEVWLNWTGGTGWERVFDFGSASGSSGQTYLFITPRRGTGSGNMRVTMSLSGTGSEVVLDAPAQLPSGSVRHLALVVDDQNELRLYLDGALQGSVANTRRLSQLSDVNNWIGRSNYSVDNELGGTYHELRIYDAALSDAQIAASFAFGPDPAFLE